MAKPLATKTPVSAPAARRKAAGWQTIGKSGAEQRELADLVESVDRRLALELQRADDNLRALERLRQQ